MIPRTFTKSTERRVSTEQDGIWTPPQKKVILLKDKAKKYRDQIRVQVWNTPLALLLHKWAGCIGIELTTDFSGIN